MVVYVVTCFMEGCEECGDEHHVVGVFANEEKARENARKHEENSDWENEQCENSQKHVHSCLTTVQKMEVQ